jgi:hypothetical protein
MESSPTLLARTQTRTQLGLSAIPCLFRWLLSSASISVSQGASRLINNQPYLRMTRLGESRGLEEPKSPPTNQEFF